MIPPLARRFVAGETAAEVLERARRLQARDVGTICNRLGEHYDERGPADEDAAAYCRLVDDVADAGLRARVSVKPSQLGLDVGEDVFRENLARVVDRADDRGVFVWLDMEDHPAVDATLNAYEHHAEATGGDVGVCVQANLRRTRTDLERLGDLPGSVRLVKGAYDPPEEVAYRRKERVDAEFRDCLRYMFANFEDGVAVGSHDPEMLSLADSLHEEFGTPYEVQMLMGVREDALFDLADDCEVWQYVPYGDRWLSYFYRRVAERRQNALFALRAVLSG
ncbi:proline dehydrogenase family protein [Halomicrobium urmianum]|uniref:proline dehydrogenase family protein n=1 Tax=Halomicrobium urmianum TaxID=1586233 RepID=UPI001CD94689|nr:proline dehydrogenase family protein [Halomicrobium urmianum]